MAQALRGAASEDQPDRTGARRFAAGSAEVTDAVLQRSAEGAGRAIYAQRHHRPGREDSGEERRNRQTEAGSVRPGRSTARQRRRLRLGPLIWSAAPRRRFSEQNTFTRTIAKP